MTESRNEGSNLGKKRRDMRVISGAIQVKNFEDIIFIMRRRLWCLSVTHIEL